MQTTVSEIMSFNENSKISNSAGSYSSTLDWIREQLHNYLLNFGTTIILAGLICREDSVYIAKNLEKAPPEMNKISVALNGDGGMGLTQITSYKEFLNKTDPEDYKAYISKTHNILMNDYNYFMKHYNFLDTKSVAGYNVAGINAALCAYNAGQPRVKAALNDNKTANSVTTGGNYGNAVLKFAAQYYGNENLFSTNQTEGMQNSSLSFVNPNSDKNV